MIKLTATIEGVGFTQVITREEDGSASSALYNGMNILLNIKDIKRSSTMPLVSIIVEGLSIHEQEVARLINEANK